MFDLSLYLNELVRFGYLGQNEHLPYELVAFESHSKVHANVTTPCLMRGTPTPVTAPVSDLIAALTAHGRCSCPPRTADQRAHVPSLTDHIVSQLTWIAEDAPASAVYDNLAWANFKIITRPPNGARADINAAVAARFDQIVGLAYRYSRDIDVVNKRARLLREGERRCHQVANVDRRIVNDPALLEEYAYAAQLTVDPAPATASPSEVIAHHDAIRVWMVLTQTDLLFNGVFAHVSPQRYGHHRLPGGRFLVSLPAAALAGSKARAENVVGPDAGYAADDVATVAGLLSPTVPLDRAMSALDAARS